MPNYTTNYNLKKPLANENYNVEDQNDNMDTLDQKLKEIDDKVGSIEVPVTSVNGKTGVVELTASDIGAETPSGAAAAANAALTAANAYTDQEVEEVANTLSSHLTDSMFKTTGGTANAQTITLSNNFDFTKDGNMLFINPSFTNTGAMTINPNAQGAKAIKKFNIDTNAYVNIEAGDVKKNNPLSLRWDLTNGFFVLAPRGGSNIKSKQVIVTTWTDTTLTKDITISSVDVNKTIVKISGPAFAATPDRLFASVELINSTTVRLTRKLGYSFPSSALFIITVTEYNNVKSKQSGIKVMASTDEEIVAIGAIEPNKSILEVSLNVNTDRSFVDLYLHCERIISSTSIGLTAGAGAYATMYWQVLEFN